MRISNTRIFFQIYTSIFIILAHILFDDAFESDDNEDSTPNRFVLEFASLMNEAARLFFFFLE